MFKIMSKVLSWIAARGKMIAALLTTAYNVGSKIGIVVAGTGISGAWPLVALVAIGMVIYSAWTAAAVASTTLSGTAAMVLAAACLVVLFTPFRREA